MVIRQRRDLVASRFDGAGGFGRSGASAQDSVTGDLLVVWTQHSAEEMRRGLIRARLSSAISRTNGALWEFFQNVESIVRGSEG